MVKSQKGSELDLGARETCLDSLFVTCRRLQRHGSFNQGSLAAVILLVVVGAKLEAVVGATYQISFAASVAVIVAAISGPITVTLTLITGGLRSTAPPAVVIPTSTSLT